MFNHHQLHRIFDISLRNTNKLQGKNVSCLIIGANNGTDDDTLCGYIHVFDWKAVMVEPLPEHVAALQVNFNRQIKQGKVVVAAECCSDAIQCVEMGWIPYEVIKQHDLHAALRGMSCILPAENGFNSDAASRALFETHKQTMKFVTKTIDVVCEEHYMEHIDYVQCDVEGYDLRVLSKFNFAKYKPKVFKFESRNIDACHQQAKDLFEQHGYGVYSLGGDSLAIHGDHLLHLQRNERWKEVLMLHGAASDNIAACFHDDVDTQEFITEI